MVLKGGKYLLKEHNGTSNTLEAVCRQLVSVKGSHISHTARANTIQEATTAGNLEYYIEAHGVTFK